MSAQQQLSQWQQDKSNFRVNADNSDKKAVAAFWIIFLVLLIIIFVTSNFTPYTFVFKSNRSQLSDTHHNDCTNPVLFEKEMLICQPFNMRNPKLGLIMRNLSPLNQFAQINLVLLPNSLEQSTIQIKQMFGIELMSLKRKNFVAAENRTLIGFQKGEDIKIINNISFDTAKLKLKEVVSDKNTIEKGYQINLGYYRQFRTKDALLIVTFQSIDWQLFKNYNVFLMAILMNQDYTKFIIIMRGVFLGIMTLSTAFYLSKIIFVSRTDQQNMVAVLSVAIIFFNDPYYFVGVFHPNVFSIFIQTIFVSLFIILLFGCWVYMLQKINTQSRGKQLKMDGFKKWISIIICIDYFFIIFAFNYQIGYYAYTDSPIIPSHKVFSHLLFITLIFFGLLFSYIIYLYFRIIQVWQSIIWRNKLYVTFNIFFISLVFIFASLGWFSLYDESSQKFEILYASMNIYVLYMHYMYSHASTTNKDYLNEEMQEIPTVSTTIGNQISINQAVIDLDEQSNQKEQEKYIMQLKNIEQ